MVRGSLKALSCSISVCLFSCLCQRAQRHDWCRNLLRPSRRQAGLKKTKTTRLRLRSVHLSSCEKLPCRFMFNRRRHSVSVGPEHTPVSLMQPFKLLAMQMLSRGLVNILKSSSFSSKLYKSPTDCFYSSSVKYLNYNENEMYLPFHHKS